MNNTVFLLFEQISFYVFSVLSRHMMAIIILNITNERQFSIDLNRGVAFCAEYYRNRSIRANISAKSLLSIITKVTIRKKSAVRCHLCAMKFKLYSSIKTYFHIFTLRVIKKCPS